MEASANVRGKGFLRVDNFDATYYGISTHIRGIPGSAAFLAKSIRKSDGEEE